MLDADEGHICQRVIQREQDKQDRLRRQDKQDMTKYSPFQSGIVQEQVIVGC